MSAIQITKLQEQLQPLVGIIDTGFSANIPNIDYSHVYLGSDYIDGDNNPLVAGGIGNEHGSYVLQIIHTANPGPLWLGRAVGSGKWAESLVEFVHTAKASGYTNAVINLSFDLVQVNPDGSVTTRYELTSQERAAVEYARQNGVLIVAAAGNENNTMSALGQASQEFDNIITVGAANGLFRANYSSYGNGLTLLADGASLGTPLGTSVATARVTSAISQIWSVNPQLGYDQIADILKTTATDLNTPGWDEETGFGLLNSSDALNLATSTIPVRKYTLTKADFPTFEASTIENAIALFERPAFSFGDIWDGIKGLGKGVIKIGGVLVDVAKFPFKTAADAVAFVTDKIGDGIDFGLDAVGLDLPGDILNSVIDRAGGRIQGIIERGVQYVEKLPSRIDRTADDFFSDKLWNNFGGWIGENLINAVELYGISEVAETVAENFKINTRGLTKEEKTLARSVFGNSINLDLVRIDEWSIGSKLSKFGSDWDIKSLNPFSKGRPFTTFNTINTWGSLDKATLIHELTHVWQYGQVGAIYIPDALASQNDPGIAGSYPSGINEPPDTGYRYGGFTELEKRMEAGQGLSSFNYEQQAAIVEDYYTIKTDDPNIANDEYLPLYAYFVKRVSSLPLTSLVPDPYGLVLGNKFLISDWADSLTGNDRHETLVGFGGNDTLDGGSGNDRLYGGLGNDTLTGGAGNDVLKGGSGDDFLVDFSLDTNQLLGGLGDDQYFINPSGNNTITEGLDEGIDTVNALFGNYMLGDNLENLILVSGGINGWGNNLNNTITGNGADNYLFGEGGDDYLIGSTGNDQLNGGDGNDLLYGEDGNDYLIGDGGNDVIDSGTGDDTLNGWIGDDNLYGGMENDTLYGYDGYDYLQGDDGSDLLNGEAADDILVGGTGDDTLNGFGGGNEVDSLYGNEGADLFILGDASGAYYQGLGGYALIEDFNYAEGDKFKVFGSASDYSLQPYSGSNAIDILYQGQRIATVQNTSDVIISADFIFA